MRVLSLRAIAVVLAGCGTGPRNDPPPAVMGNNAGLAFPLPSVRRPTRRYYFARAAHRCVVYSVDHDEASAREAFPCPTDLFDGERIRLVGKTCMRESDTEDRREPVVCPEPLTKLEERVRAAEH